MFKIGVKYVYLRKLKIFCEIEKEYKIIPIRDKNFRVWLEWKKNISENTRFFCKIWIKMYGNRKLLQSEIKILECDWSKKYRIQENADF